MFDVNILYFITYPAFTSSLIRALVAIGTYTSFEGIITDVSVYLLAVIEMR